MPIGQDEQTRQSTSGGLVMRGMHVVKHWSRTQATVALSSAEAELNASVKGASEGIYLRNTAKSIGMNLKVSLFGDSSAAKGIMSRTGAGPVKHLGIKQLWIQEKVRNKEVEVTKVAGTENLADALTKNLDSNGIAKHLSIANCLFCRRTASSNA